MLINMPQHQLTPMDPDWNDPIRRVYDKLRSEPGFVLQREYLRALIEGRYGAAAMIAKVGRERTPFPVEFPHWGYGHDY